MTNFDFLTSDPQFNTFSSVAVAAERILPIDPFAAILNCRQQKQATRQINIDYPTESGQAGDAEKGVDAEIFWVR